MRFLIDMNLAPEWVSVLHSGRHEAKHLSDVGRFDAPDIEILNWARENGYVIFANDLDFGTVIASTNATFPSVIQIRDLDVTPTANGQTLLKAVSDHNAQLKSGALISTDARRSRVHILPVRKSAVE